MYNKIPPSTKLFSIDFIYLNLPNYWKFFRNFVYYLLRLRNKNLPCRQGIKIQKLKIQSSNFLRRQLKIEATVEVTSCNNFRTMKRPIMEPTYFGRVDFRTNNGPS